MPSRQITTRYLLLVAAAAAVSFSSAGCNEKKVQAAVPVSAPPAPARPMTVAPDTDATPPLEASAVPPSVPAPSSSAPPVNVPASTAAPPPRRPIVQQSASEESGTEGGSHPEAPRIVPQLSPSDQATFQRKTEDDSSVATRNLQNAGGHQLNANQQDLADKVRTFLNQARDAGKDGDWTRAQNLAQKARLLSVELVNSL